MRKVYRIIVSTFAAVAVAAVLVSCTTVKETGRRQLLLVSPAQETQLGISAFQQMKKETPVSNDSSAKRLVDKVGRRIAAVADLPNAQWEFVVFDSKAAN